MSERDIYMNLFNFSVNTYYLWKKQERPIINLLEKYYTKEEMEEFLKTGKIRKFDFMRSNFINNYSNSIEKLHQIFGDGFALSHDSFHHFIFSLFLEIKKNQVFSLSMFTSFCEFYFFNYSLTKEEKEKIYYQVQMRMDNIFEDKIKKDYLFSLIQNDFRELLLVEIVEKDNPKFDSVLLCSFLYVGFLIFNNFEVKINMVNYIFKISNNFISENFQMSDDMLLKQFNGMIKK